MTRPIDIASTITTKLQVYRRDLLIGQATGFFDEWNGQYFLITNWHTATGRHFETKEVLNKMGAIPDGVKFRVPVLGDIGQWMAPTEQLLYLDSDLTDCPVNALWREHPVYGDELDVVALPIVIPDGGAVRTICAVNTVPRMVIRIGADVFVLGYPKGMDGGGEFPIWKRASIATEPNVHRGGPRHLLIDTATREGMSGAPVVAMADGGNYEVEGPQPAYLSPKRVYRFLGIYSSRLGADEMEAQLGTVWDASLLEFILKTGAQGTSSHAL
jgi:Trypsin-like peptidase domain